MRSTLDIQLPLTLIGMIIVASMLAIAGVLDDQLLICVPERAANTPIAYESFPSGMGLQPLLMSSQNLNYAKSSSVAKNLAFLQNQ